MYGIASILCIALYLFEQWATNKLKQENGEQSSSSPILQEVQSSLEGMYLVFLPFLPCLLWSWIMIRQTTNISIVKEEQELRKKNE